MRVRAAKSLVWLLCFVTVVTAIAGLALAAMNHPSGINKFSVTGALLGAMFPLVGALIATRHPSNPIGWIFCAIGLSQGLDTLATAYAYHALVDAPGSLPGADVMAWLSNWAFAPGFGLLLTFSVLLFPDGHLPSARWRPVAWLSGVAIPLLTLPVPIASWPFRGPMLVGGVQRVDEQALSWAFSLQSVGVYLILGLGLASALSVILRFRTSSGSQRQQLKWFTYAAVVGVLTFVVTFPLPVRSVAGVIVAIVISPLIPVATGIAILRYRLYDIDLIVNRTLVYGSLTSILGAIYLLIVTLAGTLLHGSDTVTVVATLTVAALFAPMRNRLQGLIDKRFYRQKYDAARTVDAFSARLLDQVGLDAIVTELLAVVHETVQPAHASLWLRSGGAK
jgi:hypothetical protein